MGHISWTDPRTDETWEVEFDSGAAVGARAEGDYLPESHPDMICFRRGDEDYCLDYPADKSLDKHTDQELQRLLDRARERK